LAAVHRAQPKIVIVLSDNRRKSWSAAQMAASGASDFLPPNPSRTRLRTKLATALSTAAQLREGGVVITERVVIQNTPPEVSPTRPATTPLARVFTIASASGGSGKTMVASNLATYLARATAGRVLLIDLDLQFGEIAPSLHLHPQRTIEDLLEDPDELSDSLVEHTAGFQALCAPQDVLAGEKIGPDEVTSILEVARRSFDFVVVDTPPALNETCLTVFDQSEKIIITANMDVPSLKNMRRYLETIEKLDVAPDKAALLVNRSDTNIGLDLAGVGQLFPQGFLAVLPVSREIPWATNMGVPLLEAKPKSDISRQLAEGFAKLVPPVAGVEVPWITTPHAGHRKGLLGRKKGHN
jgi:Flp pilus assembly CpaE family ATPase